MRCLKTQRCNFCDNIEKLSSELENKELIISIPKESKTDEEASPIENKNLD